MVDEDTAAALRNEVDTVPYWWHSIDLGHGVVTPGGSGDTSQLLKRLALPDDLTGKTVLDIGAWDGFYSFECERRGAARVVASDLFAWRHTGTNGKGGFEVARRALGSHVEDMEIDVFEISPATVGMFDIVLFLGVLYHLRDPLLGLARAASVTRELLIVETHVDLLDVERPAMAFYPGSELGGDATNWFGPNLAALFGMLKSLGLDDAELVVLEPQVGDEEWLRTTGTGNGTQGSRRAVVHARPNPSAGETRRGWDYRPDQPSSATQGGSPTNESAPTIDEDPRSEMMRQNHALRQRGDALATEVIEMRRRLWSVESELAAAREPTTEPLGELRQRVHTLEAQLADAREQIEAVQNMKVVRWTAWPRRIVYRLRAMRS